MVINKTTFGYITIGTNTYDYDIWIFVDGSIKRRDRNHEFTLEEFDIITKDNPDIVIIGAGVYGVVKIGDDVKEKAREKGIELYIDLTPEAAKKYNELSERRIAAAFHVTC